MDILSRIKKLRKQVKKQLKALDELESLYDAVEKYNDNWDHSNIDMDAPEGSNETGESPWKDAYRFFPNFDGNVLVKHHTGVVEILPASYVVQSTHSITHWMPIPE
jgi:hypothetical protein